MNTAAEAVLHKATITVASIIQPKAKGKPGALKDTEGQYWSVWWDKLAQYQVGETYELDYEQNGIFRNVKAHKHITPHGHQSTSAIPRDSRVTTGPRIVPKQEPAHNGNGFYRPTHPRDARRMFITATLGHFIEINQVPCKAQDIANAIAEIVAAYDDTIGKDDEDQGAAAINGKFVPLHGR